MVIIKSVSNAYYMLGLYYIINFIILLSYDCFGLANISWTRAIKLIFVLKMEFSNFEGKYQKSRDFGMVQVVLYCR